MNQTAEANILSWVMIQKNFSAVADFGVDESWFFSYRAEWKFIKDHYNRYLKTPTVTLFKREFPETKLKTVPDEAVAFYVDRLRLNAISERMRGLVEYVDMLAEDQPEQCLAALTDEVFDTAMRYSMQTDTDIIGDFESRLERTKKKVSYFLEYDVPDTIRTGCDEFDLVAPTEPGMVTTIAGDSGNGKTFFGLWWANRIRQANDMDVLFVSLEMNEDEVAYRVDTIGAHEAGLRLSNYGMRHGHHGDKGFELAEYKAFLEKQKETDGKFYVYSSEKMGMNFSIGTFVAKIDEYSKKCEGRLGAVFLDYVTLLDDAIDWDKIAEVTRMIKRSADVYHVPIFQLAQSRRNPSGNIQTNDDMGMGYGIVQNSNRVIYVNQKYISENSPEKLMRVNCSKSREGQGGWVFYFEHDPDKGMFKPISKDEAKEISTDMLESL